MNNIDTILTKIEQSIDSLLDSSQSKDNALWKELLSLHPADIAQLLERSTSQIGTALFKKLPTEISIEVFLHLTGPSQAILLPHLDSDISTAILQEMPADKVTDLFGYLDSDNLKKYLKLLQKKHRQMVISLLSFDPESAGGIMNSDVLSLPDHITIEQGIDLLQHIQPKREHLSRVYVTNKENILVGYIHIHELLLNKPDIALKKIMHKNELVLDVNSDQEDAAKQMQHYNLTCAPVLDKEHHFLGIITADMVFEIIETEASEDIYKQSGQQPVTRPYFKTPFFMLLWQRVPWLIGLLLLQSVSGFILGSYQATIEAHMILAIFITMLIGTGGNAGNQSGAIVLRGLTTGEITRKNSRRVVLRELSLALVVGFLLTSVAAFRIYLDPHQKTILETFAVCSSLYIIIIASVMLGTFLPLLFERLNIDPANTAAPFLATLMDIIGILIYCAISSYILG